jgi:hypothetical protein
MNTSQRIDRGFHRLGLLLAAVPFLFGVASCIKLASDAADHAQREQAELSCAKSWFDRDWTDVSDTSATSAEKSSTPHLDELLREYGSDPQAVPKPSPEEVDAIMANIAGDRLLDLRDVGCSQVSKSIKLREVFIAPTLFSRWIAPVEPVATALAITLLVSFTIYAVVRAIGWVIGGFAAS